MEQTETATRRQMLEEVKDGLQQPQKQLPSKYFYDERGSELFEHITQLEEYYPTRTEIGILQQSVDEIADAIGPRAAIVELGSGSSTKIRLLLDNLHEPTGYIPIDISEKYLAETAENLKKEYPDLAIQSLAADYTSPFTLPELETHPNRFVAFYPGSTIGNFQPEDARQFLEQIAEIVGKNGALLIGVDLKKDQQVLERAYNDAEGITAAFNKNMLRRLNRELDADFQEDNFEHKAIYNVKQGRIEMHLFSQADQVVHLDGEAIWFREGESIHTENSYKYSLEEFKSLTEGTFSWEQVWTDAKNWFSLQYLTVK